MRRLIAIFLLALLPLQFSWAAVAPYCGHEERADAAHFGHHEHQHHTEAGSGVDADAGAGAVADVDGTAAVEDGKGPGAIHLDCPHCHGSVSVMPALPSVLPGLLSTAPPSVTVDEAGGAQPPTRPERPQWLPLA